MSGALEGRIRRAEEALCDGEGFLTLATGERVYIGEREMLRDYIEFAEGEWNEDRHGIYAEALTPAEHDPMLRFLVEESQRRTRELS